MCPLPCRVLALVLAAFLTGCSPNPPWSGPLLNSPSATPGALAGLRPDGTRDGLVDLQLRDGGYEYLSVESNAVCPWTASAAGNGGFVLSLRLGEGKYLLAGPGGHIRGGSRRLGEAPLSSYFVSYIDRLSGGRIRVTEIDYYQRSAGLTAGGRRPGADL
jgi:hypothetical protein